MATNTPSKESLEAAGAWLDRWMKDEFVMEDEPLAHLLDTMMLKARLEEHVEICRDRVWNKGTTHPCGCKCGCGQICKGRESLQRQLQERGERT